MLPWAEFHDDLITVHNIRNCDYRTVDDYTVRLYSKTYDLRRLTSVDLIVVPFDNNPKIAHVAISFGFEDRDFLVTSVEVRTRAGQKYGTFSGFFNQFTLMYVLADERDMVWRETSGFLRALHLSHAGDAETGAGDVRQRDAAGQQAGPRAGVLQHACQQLHDEHPQPRQSPPAGQGALRLSRTLARLPPNWPTTWGCSSERDVRARRRRRPR